jgi:hypothetical protein
MMRPVRETFPRSNTPQDSKRILTDGIGALISSRDGVKGRGPCSLSTGRLFTLNVLFSDCRPPYSPALLQILIPLTLSSGHH